MRDTLGLVMLQHGHRPDQVHGRRRPEGVSTYIQPYVDSGQIRRFTGNDYAADLAKGNVVRLHGAGRATSSSCSSTTRSSSSCSREQGAMLWTDNMMIPKNARNP